MGGRSRVNDDDLVHEATKKAANESKARGGGKEQH
jgi:hypothetical protein